MLRVMSFIENILELWNGWGWRGLIPIDLKGCEMMRISSDRFVEDLFSFKRPRQLCDHWVDRVHLKILFIKKSSFLQVFVLKWFYAFERVFWRYRYFAFDVEFFVRGHRGREGKKCLMKDLFFSLRSSDDIYQKRMRPFALSSNPLL